jgi:hypothetical protein
MKMEKARMNFRYLTIAMLILAQSISVKAEVSATAGFVSDYYFRGWNLGDGGAYASLDYSKSGFSAGAWWIDDGMGGNDGLETDYYFGYGDEAEKISWNVAYTRYEYSYTSDFEHEIDFTLSFSDFTVDVIKGKDDDEGGTAKDFSVFILNYSKSSFGITAGFADYDDLDDAGWDWLEVSFSGEIADGIASSIHLGVKSDEAIGVQDDGYIFIDVSKSFDL